MPRISSQPLAALCRRLSIALSAGIDARTALAREADRATWAARDCFRAVAEDVAAGQSVGDAFAARGEFFPTLFRELVALGDQSGRLPAVFERLADHYEHQVRLRRQFVSGITWPLIQLVAAILIVGFLIWILGVIGQRSGGPQHDILGLGLIGTRGLLIYIALVAGAGIIVFGLVRMLMSEAIWTGPVQRALFRVPVVGAALETVALSRLTWALGLALETGMEVRRALSVGLRSTHSAVYLAQIDGAVRRIEQGQTIHDALAGCGILPAELLDIVDVGEQSGRLPETLLAQSEQYRDRARAALAALAVLGGFLVWALVAAMIAAMVINFVAGYAAMIQDLSKPS